MCSCDVMLCFRALWLCAKKLLFAQQQPHKHTPSLPVLCPDVRSCACLSLYLFMPVHLCFLLLPDAERAQCAGQQQQQYAQQHDSQGGRPGPGKVPRTPRNPPHHQQLRVRMRAALVVVVALQLVAVSAAALVAACCVRLYPTLPHTSH